MTPVGRLERLQLLVYLAAIAAGLALGSLAPQAGAAVGVLVLPVLAALLLVTFLGVPLSSIPAAFRDARFLLTALIANFVVVPLLVAGLVLLVPDEVAGVDGTLVVLGVVLVLVVPCTDWFLTFTQLAGGDTARAVALTPVTLLLQLALLPVYVALIAGGGVATRFDAEQLVVPVLVVLVLPLLVAAAVQVVAAWAGRDARGHARTSARVARVLAAAARLPVPLLAVVLLLVAASEVPAVLDAAPLLPLLVGVFLLYLVAAVLVGVAAGRLARLPHATARTLVMSLATRNSFVVLPIALAVPEGAGVVAVVVVTQTLVELIGVTVLVRLLPRIVPAPPAPPSPLARPAPPSQPVPPATAEP
ncbi:MAG: arsenic resistance protein [Microcella sp.]